MLICVTHRSSVTKRWKSLNTRSIFPGAIECVLPVDVKCFPVKAFLSCRRRRRFWKEQCAEPRKTHLGSRKDHPRGSSSFCLLVLLVWRGGLIVKKVTKDIDWHTCTITWMLFGILCDCFVEHTCSILLGDEHLRCTLSCWHSIKGSRLAYLIGGVASRFYNTFEV